MEINFNLYYQKHIGTIAKDNEMILNGVDATCDIDLQYVNRMYVNYCIGGVYKKDINVTIDLDKNTINIPIKSDYLKQGNNQFEVVAIMKNGDIKTSQTYDYYISQSLENEKALEGDNNYPIIIQLIETVKSFEQSENIRNQNEVQRTNTFNEKINEFEQNSIVINNKIDEKILGIDKSVSDKFIKVDESVLNEIEKLNLAETNRDSTLNSKILEVDNALSGKMLEVDTSISDKFLEVDNEVLIEIGKLNTAEGNRDSILNNKILEIDSNVSTKLQGIDKSVSNKLIEVDTNVNSKISEFNSNEATRENLFKSKILELDTSETDRNNTFGIMKNEFATFGDSINEISNLENKVSNMQTDLKIENENIKYKTINGIKEFECNNGYIDNINIEGRTLFNLHNPVTATFLTSIGSNLIYPLRENTVFTAVNMSDKEIVLHTSIDMAGTNDILVFDTIQGRERKVLTVPAGRCLTLTRGSQANWGTDTYGFSKSLVLVEGEHENINNYFSGLKSVGQGDKIEVITRLYNDDKSIVLKEDIKNILSTARGLPNGTKDIIYKQGNKYYIIKRCMEVTLDGTGLLYGLASDRGTTSDCWANFFSYNQGYKVTLPSANNQICDKFPCVYRCWEKEIEGFSSNDSGGLTFIIDNSKLSTRDADGVVEYFKKNPATFVLELEVPIIEEITNFNPRCFNDKTTFLIDSGIIQSDASFEVTNSLRSELEVLKGIVSNLGNTYQRARLMQNDILDIQLMATNELFMMMQPLRLDSQEYDNDDIKMINLYVLMIQRGLKTIYDVPLIYREKTNEILHQLGEMGTLGENKTLEELDTL